MKNNILHTEFIIGSRKTIFLDLKKTKNGINYLAVTQSLINKDGTNDRSTIVFFESDLAAFAKAFSKMCVNFYAKDFQRTSNKRMSLIKEHKKAYGRWSEEEDSELEKLFTAGCGVKDLVKKMGRSEGGIRSRLEKIGLVQKELTEA